MITDSSFLAVVFCIALVAAWPSRKWLLPDLVMAVIVVQATVSAGFGAAGMYVLQSLIVFTSYFAVGSLRALANLRVSKQFSFEVFTPIFDRLLRAGLIALSSITVIELMAMLKARKPIKAR